MTLLNPKDAGLIVNFIKKVIPFTVNPEKLVSGDITLSLMSC